MTHSDSVPRGPKLRARNEKRPRAERVLARSSHAAARRHGVARRRKKAIIDAMAARRGGMAQIERGKSARKRVGPAWLPLLLLLLLLWPLLAAACAVPFQNGALGVLNFDGGVELPPGIDHQSPADHQSRARAATMGGWACRAPRAARRALSQLHALLCGPRDEQGFSSSTSHGAVKMLDSCAGWWPHLRGQQ